MSVIKGWENLPKSTEIYRNLLKSLEVYGKLDTCLHQTPFTPDNFYTKQLYNKQLLDQAPFTPETFCTKQLLGNSLSGAAMIWDSVETKGKKKHTESILMLFLLGCIRLQLFQGYVAKSLGRLAQSLLECCMKFCRILATQFQIEDLHRRLPSQWPRHRWGKLVMKDPEPIGLRHNAAFIVHAACSKAGPIFGH